MHDRWPHPWSTERPFLHGIKSTSYKGCLLLVILYGWIFVWPCHLDVLAYILWQADLAVSPRRWNKPSKNWTNMAVRYPSLVSWQHWWRFGLHLWCKETKLVKQDHNNWSCQGCAKIRTQTHTHTHTHTNTHAHNNACTPSVWKIEWELVVVGSHQEQHVVFSWNGKAC